MVNVNFNPMRFLKPQADPYNGYATALQEMKDGMKLSHWIWYIFPQVSGLGYSYMSQYYAIQSLAEAKAYIDHQTLGTRLREITTVVLDNIKNKGIDPLEMMGSEIDYIKLKSSMTLFDLVSPNDIFADVLLFGFNGNRCEKTLKLIDIQIQWQHM